LQPVIPYHQKQLQDFQEDFWAYYGLLLDYKENPSQTLMKKLELEFDKLCTTKYTYGELKERQKKTMANKEQLLLVLKQPEIPLHNNAAELGARVQVRERDIRLHTMSKDGTRASDTFLTIIETASKLKINIIDYINDRITGTFDLPSLADLIILQKNDHLSVA
jgi:hypothetical protein